ncbi:meiotic cell cortex C-terminal pleckstrin homology-domain-containing protein [Syncephalastrum racemosum]|uniref:Meiotic cell cortex C-terminal pleckstrin homology-domain-containing protein n=1 Tax=Syncephalastrum racemosum TaxID=13706 RepID=A0A1X2H5C0_SYNRA|nr:meiotic cell cortex C-terminal pleckstrin homology-domain-containing protein [Syncephalastrum racemosum]
MTHAYVGECSHKVHDAPTFSSTAEHSATTLSDPDFTSAAVLNLINGTLLNDVRCLKAELMEKEARIEQLEGTHRVLKRRAERQDRLNDENWSLEVTRQELEARLRQAEKVNRRLAHNNERQQKELQALVNLTEEREMETLEKCDRLEQQVHALKDEKRQVRVRPYSSSAMPAPSRTLSPPALAASSPPIGRDHLSAPSFNTKKKPITPSPSSLTDEDNPLLHVVRDLRIALEKERAEKVEVQRLLSESQDRVEQQQHELSCSSIIVCQTPELSNLPVDASTQCDKDMFLSQALLASPVSQHLPSPRPVHQREMLLSMDMEDCELEKEEYEDERKKAIDAVTHTMIGDWMTKTTRRYVVNKTGISQYKRHRRYCWIHPYTRTLYWSAIQPDVDHHEAKAKQAFIQDIWSVPAGPQALGLLIRTPARDIHLMAPTMEIHDRWLMALCYLIGGGLLKRRQPNYTFMVNGESRLGRGSSVPKHHCRNQST